MATPEHSRSAVALRYQGGKDAPQVIAKGRGEIAEAIIARAHESGVFVHESRELVALLMQVDLDARIPPGLYIAIAELLAWIYRLDLAQAPIPAGDRTPRPASADDEVQDRTSRLPAPNLPR